jgi:uncharacterized protein
VLFGTLLELERDCAYPSPPAAVCTAAGDEHALTHELYTEALMDGWMIACNTLGGGAPAVLDRTAWERLATFTRPRPLLDDVDRRLATSRLITPPGAGNAPVPGKTTTLTAWMHVTNACNLECPYCYVHRSSARMSWEAGARAVDSLVRSAVRHGFTTLKLKYAGGEAALHYRMVQRLHAYATEQSARHGLELRAVVLSNGTVMPSAFAEWLAGTGVRLMLSVDGANADHDAARPWKGGGDGAFATLERNLTERLLPRGIRPDVCITITGRNAHRAHHAVAWALDHDLPFSLNFYRENEQSARHHELRYEEQQIIAGMRAIYALLEARLPTRPFLSGLLDRVQGEAHGHTCGVGQSYVVITHEGAVAQCQMHLAEARPVGGDDDVLALVASGAIHNPHVDEKEGCRECHWRYRCTGGCPLVTLRATGRTDVRSPNCTIYRTLLPEALRLEGLRVLKAHGYLA